jgi:hypothetical protein
MRWSLRVSGLFGLAFLVPFPAGAHLPDVPPRTGALVSVAVEVDGRAVPLYAAPDGSPRQYLEAVAGREYALRLANRTAERVGVAITVDGLNAISGERHVPARGLPRMYILDPWGEITVRGWRTSLQEVRRFTFVDEQRSYATRSGQSNAKLGWIEVAVHRERRPVPPPEAPVTRERDQSADSAPQAGAVPRRNYPGTGWGRRSDDPAVLVDFDAQPVESQRTTLRYEYAWGLRALGIDVRPWHASDRLRERDRGDGFAKPPRW